MPRIADALERESRTVELEPGDFGRLRSRRERKERDRHIRAGVVGVLIALATAAFLVRAIEMERVPAEPPNPLGAGEVLYGGSARDPDTGASRTIVHTEELPTHAGTITAAAWSFDRT